MTRKACIGLIDILIKMRFKHILFDENEFIYCDLDGKIYDEDNYVFEDWTSSFNDGLRIRKGDQWEDGWICIDDGLIILPEDKIEMKKDLERYAKEHKDSLYFYFDQIGDCLYMKIGGKLCCVYKDISTNPRSYL